LGSIEPESFAMLLVCQSIRPPSLRGWENQAIFATRSPTAIRNI
jgi:tRNA (Thr-GGU) A37 N-methylase